MTSITKLELANKLGPLSYVAKEGKQLNVNISGVALHGLAMIAMTAIAVAAQMIFHAKISVIPVAILGTFGLACLVSSIYYAIQRDRFDHKNLILPEYLALLKKEKEQQAQIETIISSTPSKIAEVRKSLKEGNTYNVTSLTKALRGPSNFSPFGNPVTWSEAKIVALTLLAFAAIATVTICLLHFKHSLQAKTMKLLLELTVITPIAATLLFCAMTAIAQRTWKKKEVEKILKREEARVENAKQFLAFIK